MGEIVGILSDDRASWQRSENAEPRVFRLMARL